MVDATLSSLATHASAALDLTVAGIAQTMPEAVRSLDLPIPVEATAAMSIGVGIVLLLFGRRFYWLALACLGFMVALHLTQTRLVIPDPEHRLILSLALGLVGAIMAVMVQKVAVAVAGLILGAWGGFVVASFVWPEPNVYHLACGVLAAVLGWLFASKVFDAALIVISSAIGATLVCQPLELPQGTMSALWLVLTIVGIAVQVGPGRRKAKLED